MTFATFSRALQVLLMTLAIGALATARADGETRPIVRIIVTDVETPRGLVLAALYDEASWSGAPVALSRAAVTSSTVVIDLTAPSPGRFGVRLFQDLDGDGELDTNVVGIPSEPYGFSNNAPAPFGPPTFAQAAFDVATAGANQTISLH